MYIKGFKEESPRCDLEEETMESTVIEAEGQSCTELQGGTKAKLNTSGGGMLVKTSVLGWCPHW